jgi:hypothetical protein
MKTHTISSAIVVFLFSLLVHSTGFAQTFVNGYTSYAPDSPSIVFYGKGTNTTAALKTTTFQCDPRFFPALKTPLPDWSTCMVYPIKSVATCVPTMFGGTGVGIKLGGSGGIEINAWMSWWCPGAADKTVPVVVACKGLADCANSISRVAESNKPFAEAVQSVATTTVTSPEMLLIWQGSIDRIAAGRP